jgi:hypothetical protein
MADLRITELFELTKDETQDFDVLAIADISASETKKITVKNLVAAGIDLVSEGEIDLSKLDQSSSTKLETEALADGSITADKLGHNSSIFVSSIPPLSSNFTGRGYFSLVDGNFQVYNGEAFQQLVLGTSGLADAAVTTPQLADGAVTTSKVTPLESAALANQAVITTKLADGAVTSAKIAVDSITAVQIAPNAIGASELANDSVDTDALINGSITADKLAQGSVNNSALADLSVTNNKIADATISYGKLNLADESIPGTKLTLASITDAQIAPASLTSTSLANSAVVTIKLADLSVTNAKLGNDSVTTEKLSPSSVTSAKLADNAVATASLQNLAVTAEKTADGAVTNVKLADAAVTTSKLADTSVTYEKLNLSDNIVPGVKLVTGSVTAAQLGTSAVTSTALAPESVTSAKLAPLSVTTNSLADNAVTTAKLAVGSITAAQLSSNAVTTTALIDGAITTNKLATGSVTALKLEASAVTTAAIADGAVTAAKLNLATGSIAGAALAPNSVTADQLAASSVDTSELLNEAVTTEKLSDASVTTAKLAPAAVSSSNLSPSAVTTSALATGAVTYDRLQATSTSNIILGRATALGGVVEEIPCTAAGRALLADTSADLQRDTLGLGDLAVANGIWVEGSSFSGTSSGTNTGDQTITLTGAIIGSGTGTFSTALSNDVVLEANIATGAVTSAKIASGAITAERLAGNSTVVVNSGAPTGSGAFIGQRWLNATSAQEYTWTGAAWLQQAGITAIAIEESTPIALNVSYPDPYTAVMTATLDLQGVGTVWAGPISGGNGEPTFRQLVSTDLPLATTSDSGAIKPGSGLSIPGDGSGVLNHSNSVTGSTISGITFDNQGHISGAVPLLATDIPELDASKIGTGSLSADRIAAKSITRDKLGDYATARLGETLPVADFIGQIFLNPLDKTFFMWDGNVWVPIGISAGQVVFAGTYDASENKVASVTSDGAAIGLTVGQPLPLAGSSNSSYYVVVSVSGLGLSPAPEFELAPPDIILSNGVNWVEIDVSSTYVAQSASNVNFTPAAQIGSTTVQNAIEEVSTECRNADNLTSGVLALARGGTGLTSYAKGELIAGNASNVLAKLSLGTNGQTLTVDTATATGLKWQTPTVYVNSVGSSTAALTVTNPTTAPSLAIRSASTAVNGIVQLSDSISTTSSTLAATPTAVKAAYDLANAALPKGGGTLFGDLLLGQNVGIVYEGATIDAFQTRIFVAEPTADHNIFFPNSGGTLALTSQLDDGTF